ncbi:MAG: hypothetical protein NTU47_18375 [Ignavibacteriales bacterium]|nr:hypothetical protein [Ignavibacteriales bacterium]
MLYVLALGLVLRVVFIALHERPLISDEREYDTLASTLASTGRYAVDGIPTAYRPIGYPAFVGSLYFVFGHHPAAVKVFQAGLDVATAFLLFVVLVGYPARTRILAAGLWAFYVPAILYSNFLMSESFFTFVLALAGFLFTRLGENRKSTVISFGICFGILVLMKPGTILIMLFLPIILHQSRIPLRRFYPAVVSCILVLAPWIVRNYVVFDEAALSSNGGINLLIGNNPHATGAYAITFDPQVCENTKGEFDTDSRAFELGMKYIIDSPGTFVLNAFKKVGHLFESEGGLIVWTFHSHPEDQLSRYSAKYASIPLPLTLLANLPYFIMIIGGIFGFLGSRKNAFWLFAMCLGCTWVALHAVFFGGGRFHFPLMPFAVLFCAIGLTGGIEMIRAMPKVQKMAGGFIVVLFTSLWIYEGIVIFHG